MKSDSIKRAVAYARFSSEMQREESIDAQLRAIREYSERNNITLVGTYIDRAKSATSDQRPEFQRMISDAATGQFDAVIVHKLDRFARNRYDSANYKYRLKRYNVQLLSVTENIDGSPESIVLESVLEGMAEYYSRNLAREVEKGKKENARQGRHIGGIPPLGYDVDPHTRKLVINEQEAQAVRMIFSMFVEEKGYTEIRNALNSRGLTTKRGQMFGKNSIHEIVRNEKYTGVYIYNKTAAKSIDGKMNRHRSKDEDEIIRVEGAVPAIISTELFEQAQELLKHRQHKGARFKARETYLLSGKIVCGECGAAFAGNHRKAYANHPEYTSYRCTRKNNAVVCRNKEVNRDEVESLVLRTLADKVFDERLVERLEAEYRDYIVERDKDTASEMALLAQSIKDFDRQINNIVTVMAQTGSAALAKKLKELERLREKSHFEFSKLEMQQSEKTLSGEQFMKTFRMAKSLIASGTLESKRQLVDQFVDKVIIYADHIEIKLKISNGFQLSQTEAK